MSDSHTAGEKVNKYGNKKGGGFDSKREAKRFGELQLLERIGEITELETQPVYELIPKQDGERRCDYRADFRYKENGKIVVEDCKGFRTEVYRIKRKLLLFRHGIKVRET